MLTKKINLVIFLVLIAVIGLAVASLITFNLVEDTRTENEGAQIKIDELKSSVNSLEAALEGTKNELADHENRIKKYQEIINAWSKATPNVNEAVQKIVEAGEEVLMDAHLYPVDKIKGFEDEMMDAVYGAIRSADPLPIAKDFAAKVDKLREVRYDTVMSEKTEKIKQNGVTFPEDKKAVEELRAYYDSFLEDAAVINSFKELGFDKALDEIEALLDADEENDLAKAFEDAVAEIKTPITPTTSFTKANDAWDALCDAFEQDDTPAKSTVCARAVLDVYILQANKLINLTKKIRTEIDRIHTVDPDVTHEEIAALDLMVDELLALDVTVDALNTDDKDYVALLEEARLLPHKNDAFAEVKAAYDVYYAKANGDRDVLIALVDRKDATFNAIENAKSIETIDDLVKNAKAAFEDCFK